MRQEILTAPINVIGWNDSVHQILSWASGRQSRYVCICNVHSVVTAQQDPGFRKVISEADMATPDGMPVVWMLRQLGYSKQMRINGPDLLWKLCGLVHKSDISVYFYGGSDQTLQKLQTRLSEAFPNIRISGMKSPPYRMLSEEEAEADIRAINDSGAGIVFVCLGCPKQERWMEAHRGLINAVMIGVGAAFDYHAGTIRRAPVWMQNIGLEWFFRLMSEPRRLWKRYLITNTLFIVGAFRQLLMRG